MKIAFIMGTPVVSASNGVKMQALSWKKGLEELGHNVKLISPWEIYNWKEFDIIHIFSFNEYTNEYVKNLYKINPNIVISPILDPNHSCIMYKILSYWGSQKFRIHNKFYDFRVISSFVKGISVRSKFEHDYIEGGLGISNNRIDITPLSYRFSEVEIPNTPKKNYCFHVSFLADKRKNVERLILSAKKYGFNLKLAGKLRNNSERIWLEENISGCNNIEYLGFLSDEELIKHYKEAKVFALPSLYEGVGLVALEAAIYGCKIVITNQGGPKEYYNGLAKVVNPKSIDEIGQAITKALNEPEDNKLYSHIAENYSLQHTMTHLVNWYKKIMQS